MFNAVFATRVQSGAPNTKELLPPKTPGAHTGPGVVVVQIHQPTSKVQQSETYFLPSTNFAQANSVYATKTFPAGPLRVYGAGEAVSTDIPTKLFTKLTRANLATGNAGGSDGIVFGFDFTGFPAQILQQIASVFTGASGGW
jgi:hypothetical protein